MSGKHRTDDETRRPRRWKVPALLSTALLTGVLLAAGLVAPTAASASDHNAKLTLSGVVTDTYPTGGNTAWVQPGSTLTLSEAPLSVAGNQGLLGTVTNLLGNILGGVTQVVDLQAKVDLSSVQRGTVTLDGSTQVTTPALAKGVYPISWSFVALTVTKGLLGNKNGSIALNGNQLGSLGLKLNAQNDYVGYIVSDTKSPCSGAQCISLQVPTLSVAPSLPVVGQLPTISVPGTTVNIPVPGVPGVNTNLPGQTGSSSNPTTGATGPTTGGTTGGATSPTNPYGYTPPGCTGPCLVVPRGGSGGGSVGNAYGVTLGQLDGSTGTVTGSDNGAQAAAGSDAAQIAAGGDQQLTVNPAFDAAPHGSASSLPAAPTALSIAAVTALALATLAWFARRRFARR